MKTLRRFAAAGFVLGLLCVGRAEAGLIVVPNANATVEGSFQANSAPFNDTSRLQQVYGASEFGTAPILITQIAFRASATQGAFSHFLSELRLDLSTTPATSGTLSSTFAGNVGSDDVTVFDAPITLSSTAAAGPGNTKVFDVVINLTTAFLYNPSAGNLLLDIRNFGTGFTGYVDIAADPALSLVFVDNSTTSATGTAQRGIGLVTQFTTAAVPEPASVVMAGLGLAWVGLLGRKRRT